MHDMLQLQSASSGADAGRLMLTLRGVTGAKPADFALELQGGLGLGSGTTQRTKAH